MSINYNSADTANTINRAIDNSMGLTTTDQGASSAGLIIKEDLQPVVQCTPGFDYAVSVKEITGVPPLSFHSMGQTLIWSIDGNTDSGNSVGDKTSNLLSSSNWGNGYIGAEGTIYTQDPTRLEMYSDYILVSESTYYTFSHTGGFPSRGTEPATVPWRALCFYDNEKNFIDRTPSYTNSSELPLNYITPENCSYIRVTMRTFGDTNNYMVNIGNEALPFVPYGYDIPIIVNNTDTYHCYITDVLRKSDGETPVYDTMSSDGTIIRRVDTDGTPLETPIEETYTAPSVEVPWGNNTVDVDTTVTPSSMYIKYKDN